MTIIQAQPNTFFGLFDGDKRRAANLLTQLPDAIAKHDYMRGVVTLAATNRARLPKSLQSQLRDLERTVRRMDVLRGLIEKDVRQGVRRGLDNGSIRPDQVADFPEGLRGAFLIPILLAFAIVAGIASLKFGLIPWLNEYYKHAQKVAEAQLVEKTVNDLNNYLVANGQAPLVYVPPSNGTGAGRIGIPLVLLAGGAVVLLLMMKRRKG